MPEHLLHLSYSLSYCSEQLAKAIKQKQKKENDEYLPKYEPPIYLYKFMTEQDLVSSAVFQKHLTKCLEFKDNQIRELQRELQDYIVYISEKENE